MLTQGSLVSVYKGTQCPRSNGIVIAPPPRQPWGSSGWRYSDKAGHQHRRLHHRLPSDFHVVASAFKCHPSWFSRSTYRDSSVLLSQISNQSPAHRALTQLVCHGPFIPCPSSARCPSSHRTTAHADHWVCEEDYHSACSNVVMGSPSEAGSPLPCPMQELCTLNKQQQIVYIL